MTKRYWPSVVGIVAVMLTAWAAAPAPATAGRCTQNARSGGKYCSCPDPATLLAECEPGTTAIIYRLDQPFPPDGSMSDFSMNSAPDSPCVGNSTSVGLTGYIIGCWYPPDPQTGCRAMRAPNSGTMCLHLENKTLECPGECGSISTEEIVISNAGAADRRVCPPIDLNPPDVTKDCRSQRGSGQQKFRLWYGGLCATNGCVGDDDTNACVNQWGATYWGYAKKHDEPGWYDWKSGAFKITTLAGRPTCGKLGDCLGKNTDKIPWQLTIVATPSDGYQPPCTDAPSATTCDAQACFK